MWLRGIVGDGYASARKFDQLVSFIRLRHVPLVDHLCKGACGLVDGLARICHANNKKRCRDGKKEHFRDHGEPLIKKIENFSFVTRQRLCSTISLPRRNFWGPK
jgi:hypothetical protein